MTAIWETEDYQQFLARIRERSDDDVVRLVFADWLDERGHGERAEFVRVCCGHRERGDDPIARILGGTAEWATCGIAPDWSWSGGGTAEPYPDPVVVLMTSGVRLHFHRGFISRVSGPLASLHVGEKCKRKVCVNGRVWVNGNTQRDCRLCHGTGRTPGILAELLRREPIGCGGIEVTGVSPWNAANDRFGWADGSVENVQGGDGNWHLPTEVFDALERDPTQNGFRWRKWYSSVDAARLALSRAMYSIHAPQSEVSR